MQIKQFTKKIGDKVISSGMGRFKTGLKGEVISVESNGEFARYGVKYDFIEKIFFEREQDINKI